MRPPPLNTPRPGSHPGNPRQEAERVMDTDLDAQIQRLAEYIIENVPGEPSQSESAVDTAIRVIDALRAERDHYRGALDRIAAMYAPGAFGIQPSVHDAVEVARASLDKNERESLDSDGA